MHEQLICPVYIMREVTSYQGAPKFLTKKIY